MNRNDLTAEQLRQSLHYDAQSGLFTRLSRTSTCVQIGEIAGCKKPDGYVSIRLLGFGYMAHRLAWLYMTGAWPQDEIDHINGQRSDNRWGNLRSVSRSVNQQNLRTPNADNRAGFLGVSRDGSRWKARIKINGKQSHIGRFDTPQLAHAAYVAAKRTIHEGGTI